MPAFPGPLVFEWEGPDDKKRDRGGKRKVRMARARGHFKNMADEVQAPVRQPPAVAAKPRSDSAVADKPADKPAKGTWLVFVFFFFFELVVVLSKSHRGQEIKERPCSHACFKQQQQQQQRQQQCRGRRRRRRRQGVQDQAAAGACAGRVGSVSRTVVLLSRPLLFLLDLIMSCLAETR